MFGSVLIVFGVVHPRRVRGARIAGPRRCKELVVVLTCVVYRLVVFPREND